MNDPGHPMVQTSQEGFRTVTATPSTQCLTVAQAIVQFLAAQRVERDGDAQPFLGRAIGIFGDGSIDALAQNAASLGADVQNASTPHESTAALGEAAGRESVVIYRTVDAKGRFGGPGAWWDVPVSEVSQLDTTLQARKESEEHVPDQRLHL